MKGVGRALRTKGLLELDVWLADNPQVPRDSEPTLQALYREIDGRPDDRQATAALVRLAISRKHAQRVHAFTFGS